MSLRLNGSTSGYTEIDAPAVAGSNTLVLPTGNGTSGQVLTTNGSGALSWSGMGPAFSAYPNASTSIANVTFTKVDLQVEEFDTANCFTSSRFTPNIAGYYLFTMAVQATALGQLAPILYINGTGKYWGNSMTSTTFDSSGTAIAYMNGTTDYAEMYAYQASGASSFINPTIYRTFFQGFLARPA
jgi:hypothetical protein